jgi:anti-anti-sigma regulatory factor
MLRVITKQWGDTYRLELHGILGGDWVPLLEQQWRTIANDVPSARVTIVLSDVDFIDSDGERLLRNMAVAGVEFVVSGCMNRYLIEKLQPHSRANHEWENV